MKASALQTKSFSKGAALGGTRIHDTLLTRQSTLPTELPGQLSRQDSKSTTQHNTRQSQTPNNSVRGDTEKAVHKYITHYSD